jgi:hypothetical protein
LGLGAGILPPPASVWRLATAKILDLNVAPFGGTGTNFALLPPGCKRHGVRFGAPGTPGPALAGTRGGEGRASERGGDLQSLKTDTGHRLPPAS